MTDPKDAGPYYQLPRYELSIALERTATETEGEHDTHGKLVTLEEIYSSSALAEDPSAVLRFLRNACEHLEGVLTQRSRQYESERHPRDEVSGG